MDDGSAETVKGRLKQAAGDLTGDRDIKRDGKVDEAAGKAKEKVGEAADKVKHAIEHDDDD